MRHTTKRVLSHTTWFFDLDNTLHNANLFFPTISRQMNCYIAKHLIGDETALQEANTLRLSFWRQYGATAIGIHKNTLNLSEFFEKTHDLGDIANKIQAERNLVQFFKRFPGKKILLTNAPLIYVKSVLSALKLSPFFDVISFESMRVNGQLCPKPSYRLFAKLVSREKKAVLIEDSPKALKTAKRARMKTIWMTRYIRKSSVVGDATPFSFSSTLGKMTPYMDLKISSLRQLSRVVNRKSYGCS